MTKLSDTERLKILRAADNWRQWETLDDERLCVGCAKLITGREILITDEGDGKMSLHCPTPGCNASTRDWFYHGTCNQHVLANLVQIA